MKVECPNCQTKYNLPDSMVGTGGADVRCSLCKHTFHVDTPQGDDFPGFGDSGASHGWPVEGEDEGDSGASSTDFGAELDKQRMKDPFEGVGVSSSEFTTIDFDKPAEKNPRKTLLLAVVLGIALLAGVGTAAAYFLDMWPFAKKSAQSVMENAPATPQGKEQAPAPQPAQSLLESIIFEKYDHYFVDNDKAGKLFVIEGKLVNKSPSTLGQIKIEATLRDTAEAPLLNKTITAGPKANNFELRTMSMTDLENRLNSVQEVLLYNGAVKPGEDVPFMFVFQNAPQNMNTLSLRVVEYHEAAAPQAPAKQ
uniref:DUF3426 domain-containing protein n=1 Tax=Fundidesulfovibrio putealis TaxID=270496 RepID=A0A7C4EJU5_9BACT